MVTQSLRARKHRVVVRDHHSFSSFGTKPVGADRRDAADQSVRGSVRDEIFFGAARALGCKSQGPVLDKAVLVDEVGDVLASGTSTDSVALGNRVGTRGVQRHLVPRVDLGEIGPDVVRVDLSASLDICITAGGSDDRQRLTGCDGLTRFDQRPDQCCRGGHRHGVLHLHRFQHDECRTGRCGDARLRHLDDHARHRGHQHVLAVGEFDVEDRCRGVVGDRRGRACGVEIGCARDEFVDLFAEVSRRDRACAECLVAEYRA
ncbi:Uncharacterised protein [Mycobacteroides abscessus subsp. abscessus]|nr:Uncharacterised protein [Mycobacteroides abscessus subsp. abscessus]